MHNPPSPSSRFEQHVIDSLARLETNMKSLVGNGRPGRIELLETRVTKLTLYGLAIAVLLLGPWAFTLLK